MFFITKSTFVEKQNLFQNRLFLFFHDDSHNFFGLRIWFDFLFPINMFKIMKPIYLLFMHKRCTDFGSSSKVVRFFSGKSKRWQRAVHKLRHSVCRPQTTPIVGTRTHSVCWADIHALVFTQTNTQNTQPTKQRHRLEKGGNEALQTSVDVARRRSVDDGAAEELCVRQLRCANH